VVDGGVEGGNAEMERGRFLGGKMIERGRRVFYFSTLVFSIYIFFY
jgi:hypothetical protein